LGLARARHLRVAGVLTLPRAVGGRVVGLDVRDVRTGAVRPLAELVYPAVDAEAGKWRFHDEGLAWGSSLIEESGPCDVLCLDELGPLELLEGKGWSVAFEVLRAGEYWLALVVVRLALRRRFRDNMAGRPVVPGPELRSIRMVTVTPANRDALPGRILDLLQENR
jgi:nucleoside-triphosphatase THEP1